MEALQNKTFCRTSSVYVSQAALGNRSDGAPGTLSSSKSSAACSVCATNNAQLCHVKLLLESAYFELESAKSNLWEAKVKRQTAAAQSCDGYAVLEYDSQRGMDLGEPWRAKRPVPGNAFVPGE
nr:unnamed protein product [Fasciola hepatica]CAK6928157.1 unnamed protein product [Fasciola hepatica]CAK6928159.1 unnamed protein product [Fasciola hepatica]CAK6928160.1 unnamed protein product [Fasciola hepatica]CAK6928161.1 unnamed protein product [Fasciola hepatica]